MTRPFSMPAPYAGLLTYLAGRFADTVVLTFSEIEDLLGLPLPDAARTRADWWTNERPENDLLGYSRAWIDAKRIATPNLFARTVKFSRAPA